MPATTYSGLPYPQGGFAPNVPQDIQNLATALDKAVTIHVATPTARNALTNKYDGMRVYEESSQRTFRWNTAPATDRWDYVDGPEYTWGPTLADSGGSPVTATSIDTKGTYTIREGRIRFAVNMRFNGGINGLAGALFLQMPTGVLARTGQPEQDTVTSFIYTAASSLIWMGGGVVIGGGGRIKPMFPLAANNCAVGQLVNATSLGATGTGTPLVSGSYPLADGTIFNCWGEYELSSWPAL